MGLFYVILFCAKKNASTWLSRTLIRQVESPSGGPGLSELLISACLEAGLVMLQLSQVPHA